MNPEKRFSKESGPENIDSAIEKLLETLESYGELYDGLSPELQDWWYDVENEARAGKDRQAAKAHLEEFLGVLERIKTEKK